MIKGLLGTFAIVLLGLAAIGCSSDAPKEGDNPVATSSRDASELGERASQKEAKFGGGVAPQGPAARDR